MLNFSNLNDDILLLICDYCSNDDLLALSYCSERLKTLIESHIFFKRSLDCLVSGHRGKSIFYKRTLSQLSYAKRIKLYENWRRGCYQELAFFHRNVWFPSHLILDQNYLYISCGGQFRAHRRNLKEHIERKPAWSFGEIKEPEILTTAKRGETIFVGRSSGEGIIHTSASIDKQQLHSNESIDSVDFYENTFITTSHTCTKIWNRESEFGMNLLDQRVKLDSSFFHVRIDEAGKRFVGGKFKDTNKNALMLVDLNTAQTQQLGSETSAVYYTLWKDTNCIMTANFDTSFRVFDIRTNTDVMRWDDPYDSSVYTLDYDGLHGVLCGMKYHCRVNLYDLRVCRKFIQMYFPSLRKSMSTPAYSVAADATKLFIATGYNIRMFNFDTNRAKCKDFSNIFVNE